MRCRHKLLITFAVAITAALVGACGGTSKTPSITPSAMDSCVSTNFFSDTTLTENPMGNVSPEDNHRVWQVNVAPGERVAIVLEWEGGDDSAVQQALAEQGAQMVRAGDWVGAFTADSSYKSNVQSFIDCLNAATRYSD